MLLLLAEVPLPDETCRVTLLTHHVRDGGLGGRHTRVGVAPGDIEFEPMALLVPTGVKSRPRRAANCCCDVAIGDAYALSCQGIDMGSLDNRSAVRPDVPPTEIVDHHHDHVGPGRRGFLAWSAATAPERQEEYKADAVSHCAAILAEVCTNRGSAGRIARVPGLYSWDCVKKLRECFAGMYSICVNGTR